MGVSDTKHFSRQWIWETLDYTKVSRSLHCRPSYRSFNMLMHIVKLKKIKYNFPQLIKGLFVCKVSDRIIFQRIPFGKKKTLIGFSENNYF